LSVVWEIFGDNSTLRQIMSTLRLSSRKKTAMTFTKTLKTLTGRSKAQYMAKMATELRTKFKEDNIFDCFNDFNPNTVENYDKTIINWAKAINKFL